jgi:TPR repeat protein
MKKIFLLPLFLILSSSASELDSMKKACEKHVASACYELGILSQQGLARYQDKEQAKAYLLKACNNGFDKACQKYDELGE